ncbi:hypothetical protein RSOLAG1IB_10347 [Rhizoctonia solani AG-1 IB]|uniref:Transposase family Tnp2 protein n=1 Tax=Thanatephorus cucumeris (strain AG1-IB / isolate 7/3/14) TaxID=1108050 RepID=A0A0B7G1C0_THACB|nr:hypothetical protein RSOLAG1IB_10347 [Rhizoctonia solani AG-1 IB]
MSALARWFPGQVKKVYCSHCNQYVHPRTQYRHFEEHMSDIPQSVADAAANASLPEDLASEHGNDDMSIDNSGLQGDYDISIDQLDDEEQSQGPAGNDLFDNKINSEGSEFSRGSWYEVPTPLPSPPQSPLPEHNDIGPVDDGENFQNINADDYREYERWYTEDNLLEEDEMATEVLTEEEIDSIVMLAIRQFGTVTQSDYERMRYSYRHKLKLLSPQRLCTRITKLSGVKPINIDCCPNVCHAFTQQYAEEVECSTCNEPRYDHKGRPRQTFQYLPATPRFQAFFNNPDMIEKMQYQATYVHVDGQINDIFDSPIYSDLRRRNIVIDGIDTGVPHFPGKHDIAFAVMTDGVEIFESASTSKSSCWPIMAQNLNLPPAERAQLCNLIPLGVIPGPNKPKDFDLFFSPFVNECAELAHGVKTYNVQTGREFTLRAHPLIISGDMQAMKYIMNFKGPNARVPCRECLIVGIYHAARRTYYIPLAQPLEDGATIVKAFDPHNLPLRTDKKTASQTRKIEAANTKQYADELRMKFGINGPSILDNISSLRRPSSYPHEFMHLFLLNHGPDLISIWIGTHSAGLEAILLHADWVKIGAETEAATYLLPAAFIRPLPNIETGWSLYTAESWSFWLVYVGPVVLHGRLPGEYYEHYLQLVSILKRLLDLENTVEQIEQLREDIVDYVETFEKYVLNSIWVQANKDFSDCIISMIMKN